MYETLFNLLVTRDIIQQCIRLLGNMNLNAVFLIMSKYAFWFQLE